MTVLARLLAVLCLVNPAWAGSSLPPSPALPLALQDIGAARSCPVALLGAGQSNRVGYDTNGGKVVQPGVMIANAVTQTTGTRVSLAPTGFVQAAFGSAPLNQGLGDVYVSTAAASYNNSETWFANDLVLGGNAPPAAADGVTRVVILPNWFPGQSIAKWVGNTPGTMDYGSALVGSIGGTTLTVTTAPSVPLAVGQYLTVGGTQVGQITALGTGTGGTGTYTLTAPLAEAAGTGMVAGGAPYWQALVGQVTLYQQKFPGCPITEFDWDQGEADSAPVATSYSTAVAYQQGFSTLLAAVKGLVVNGQAMWNAASAGGKQSICTLQELATWQDNASANARNDAIDAYRGGRIDPACDVIPVDGLAESQQNPGPHFDGPSLVAIGQRLYSNFLHARVGGAYGDRANAFTSSGSADAYPNVINGPAANVFNGTGTLTTAPGLLTITAVANGTLLPGAIISGTGIQSNVAVQPYGTPVGGTATTGTGGVGTYATNVGVAATTASQTISVFAILGTADLRTGAVIYGNGGTVSLPPPALFTNRPIEIVFIPKVATNIDVSATGGIVLLTTYNGSLVTAAAGQVNYAYKIRPVYSVAAGAVIWQMEVWFPYIGATQRYAPGPFTAGAASPQGIGTLRYSNFLANANAFTLGPVAGGSFVIANSAAAAAPATLALSAAAISGGNVITKPDGTTVQTGYALAPGDGVFAESDAFANVRVITQFGKLSSPAQSTRSAAYTLGIMDGSVFANAASAAFAVTLPTCATASGTEAKQYRLKKIDGSANAVTLTAAGTDKIDGAATKALTTQYAGATVQCDGAGNWWVQ